MILFHVQMFYINLVQNRDEVFFSQKLEWKFAPVTQSPHAFWLNTTHVLIQVNILVHGMMASPFGVRGPKIANISAHKMRNTITTDT
jgi:hypothetical protein